MSQQARNAFELRDAALDWAVAQSQGVPVVIGKYYEDKVIYKAPFDGVEFAPSRVWETGGPLFAKALQGDAKFREIWLARFARSHEHVLEMAMQCLVASVCGDTVDVPSELL